MSAFSFTILYVDNPPASAAFYSGLLGKPIVEQAPTFAMLPLAEGVMLGLWRRDDVQPAVGAPAGGAEIAFTVEDSAALDRLNGEWKARGVKILQEPAEMDFGRTFTAADPDGHRIRVFVPAAR